MCIYKQNHLHYDFTLWFLAVEEHLQHRKEQLLHQVFLKDIIITLIVIGSLGVHPEDRIPLIFSVFDLEHEICRWDYLEIRDGEDEYVPLKDRFCGSLISQSIASSGNKLWIKFKADASFNGQGFKTSYFAQCEGEYNNFILIKAHANFINNIVYS